MRWLPRGGTPQYQYAILTGAILANLGKVSSLPAMEYIST